MSIIQKHRIEIGIGGFGAKNRALFSYSDELVADKYVTLSSKITDIDALLRFFISRARALILKKLERTKLL